MDKHDEHQLFPTNDSPGEGPIHSPGLPDVLEPEEVEALRISRAATRVALGQAELRALRAEALLVRLQAEQRLKDLDERGQEVVRQIGEAKGEVDEASRPVLERYGASARDYFFDDAAGIFRKKQDPTNQ